jgi:type III secretion protein J
MLFLAAFIGCGTTPVHRGLEERAANELLAELVEHGIAAQRVPEGGRKKTWSVEVPDSEASDAIRVMVRRGLPRISQPESHNLSRQGLVPSPAEEHQSRILGLQGDLARSLELLDGVHAARVHLVVPTPQRPGSTPLPSRASVLLRVRPGQSRWDPSRRESIQAWVAGSVEGLQPAQVVVVVDELPELRPTAAPSRRSPDLLRRVVGTVVGLLAALACAWAIWGRSIPWRSWLPMLRPNKESIP